MGSKKAQIRIERRCKRYREILPASSDCGILSLPVDDRKNSRRRPRIVERDARGGWNFRQTDTRQTTGRRAMGRFKWAMQDSNLRHLPCKELRLHRRPCFSRLKSPVLAVGILTFYSVSQLFRASSVQAYSALDTPPRSLIVPPTTAAATPLSRIENAIWTQAGCSRFFHCPRSVKVVRCATPP